jgi:hypothetical protein
MGGFGSAQGIWGAGVINTRKMNECLLLKWKWKIVQKEKSLWCEFLYAKYMKRKDFFSVKSGGGHSFGGVAESQAFIQVGCNS